MEHKTVIGHGDINRRWRQPLGPVAKLYAKLYWSLFFWLRNVGFFNYGWAQRFHPRVGGGTLSNTAENKLALLIFNATAWASVADNAASSPYTNTYISLHTADPGEAGNQSTNEISYTGYARLAVARTSGGWSVSANVATLVATGSFPASTGGTGGTITHIGVGWAATGAGELFGSGTYTPNGLVANGVTPQVSNTTTITFD